MSDVQEYIRQVNAGFENRYGVSLVHLGDDLFGREQINSEIRGALDSGCSVNDFIATVEKRFALVPHDEVQTRYRAALVGFCDETEGWRMDGQGAIVAQHEDGLLRMNVVPGTDGRPAKFAVSIAHGVEFDVDDIRATVPTDLDFAEVCRAADISDALLAFRNEYVPSGAALGRS